MINNEIKFNDPKLECLNESYKKDLMEHLSDLENINQDIKKIEAILKSYAVPSAERVMFENGYTLRWDGNRVVSGKYSGDEKNLSECTVEIRLMYKKHLPMFYHVCLQEITKNKYKQD